METLRSLRHVDTRTPKPGSARRVPVPMAVRVLATSGVLISALALVGVGAAEAATSGHVSSDSHASAQAAKAGHSAKAHADAAKRGKATGSLQARNGSWLYEVMTAKGPFLW
jgi:hypothetical protein